MGPLRHTPSPARNIPTTTTKTTSPYYGHPGASSNLHQSSRRPESDIQGPSHLSVPNLHRRSRPSLNGSVEMDQMSSSGFTYPSGFAVNTISSMPSPESQTNMNHVMNSMHMRTHERPNEDSLMMRVYSSHHDEPWSAMRLTNSEQVGPHVSTFPGSSMAYRQPNHTGSDLGSALGPTSDSGYYTQPPAPQSVISNEPEHLDQELPSDMFRLPNLTVSSAPSESTECVADHVSQYSSRSASHPKSTYKCSRCNEISKCPSDFKYVRMYFSFVSELTSETRKHMLKHDKPHTCDVSGCRRAAQGKGFTTSNDLQRHKKSVHRIGVELDSYQCASDQCRNRGKIWPRLDNFKQHISRMHKDEDEQDLIRK